MRFRNLFAVVLLLVLATQLQAAQIDWKGPGTDWATGNNWTGLSAPGATDVANFKGGTGVYTPVVAGSQTLGGLRFDQTAASGYTFTTNPVGGGQLILAATNGITIVTGTTAQRAYIHVPLQLTAATVWNVPAGAFGDWSTDNTDIRITRPITGTGSILKIGGGGPGRDAGGWVQVLTNATPHTFSGGTTINAGGIRLDTVTQNGVATFGFGKGPITLNGGSFQFCAQQTASSGLNFVTLTNAIVVNAGGGGMCCLFRNKDTSNYPKGRFSGDIELGGRLVVGSGLNYGHNSFAVTYSGTISIRQSAIAMPTIATLDSSPEYTDATLSGGIQDGAGAWRNPLVLSPQYGNLTVSGAAAGMTYANGTVIDYSRTAYNVTVGSTSGLGNGNVVVMPGVRLYLNGSGTIASGKTVTLLSSTPSLAVVSVGYDGVPPLTSSSYGMVGLNVNNSTITSLASLGNGNMFVGSLAGYDRSSGASLTVSSLAACSDGKWRFGAASGRLDFTQTGVISGSGTMQVGDFPRYCGGYVAFQKAINGFTGTMDIRNAGVIGYALTTASTYTMGDPYSDVDLHNGVLRYANVAAAASVKVGRKRNVTFEGGNSMVSAHSGAAGYSTPGNAASTCTTLGITSLTRVHRGQLLIDAYSDRFLNSDKKDGANNRTIGTERICVTNVPPKVNGIVPPYFIAENAWAEGSRNTIYDFATYDEGVDLYGKIGFDRGTNYYTKSLMTSSTTGIVNHAGGTLTADCHAYAIRMNGTITTNNLGTVWTVTLGTNGYAGILVINACDFHPKLDVQTNELVVYTVNNSLFKSKISGSGGLTKAGAGELDIYSPANNFTGDVTVNRGTLVARYDTSSGVGSLGDQNNTIVLNGGSLQTYNNEAHLGVTWPTTDRLLSSRTIQLWPLGGGIGPRLGQVYILGKVTGPGPYIACGSDNTYSESEGVVFMNPNNDYSGGTRVTAAQIVAAYAAGKLGTGDVLVEQTGLLRLYGTNNIAPTARLWVFRPGLAYAYTNTCTVGSIGGTGNIRLGRTAAPANDTTLIVGGDNTSFDYYGVIYQASGTTPGKGGVTKEGTGTFTLYNNQSFTKDLTINKGTLALMGSVASNVVVNANGTLGGIGRVKGNLLISGGKLSVVLRGDTDFDSITVDKIADVASGTLDVSFAPGYVPPKGKQWTILTAGTCNSNFAGTSSGFSTRRVGNTILVTNPPKGTVIEVL